jgi:hypothetical protein
MAREKRNYFPLDWQEKELRSTVLLVVLNYVDDEKIGTWFNIECSDVTFNDFLSFFVCFI